MRMTQPRETRNDRGDIKSRDEFGGPLCPIFQRTCINSQKLPLNK